MALLAADLGGTKLALAVFSEQGELLHEERHMLENRKGSAVGDLVRSALTGVLGRFDIASIGMCIPGIYHKKEGQVWAPNIEGWDKYPLLAELENIGKEIPVAIDSDRACSILGEHWKGGARGCHDAIFLAVGTGIGAGILCDGRVLRGAHDIAGAIGWLALERPFKPEFVSAGCFEGYASGEGMVKYAKRLIDHRFGYEGELNRSAFSASDVFTAFEHDDPIAISVVATCIELWGMTVANLVSLFDTEKIIFGGGVFGPATRFLPEIRQEAAKWAQPVSIKMVSIEGTQLHDKAGLYGAGLLALQNLKS